MDGRKECSCERGCLRLYATIKSVQSHCITAEWKFQRLEQVIKLQADVKKGIELIMPNGKTFKQEYGSDFSIYRVAAILSVDDAINDIEKCPSVRELIKGTEYEKIYFEARERHSEAIEKFLKISDEDILRLEKDPHYEIDL
ncbi:uncharacterized protein LOC130674912 isoform X2 [Microplitis mediator]|uniref:uncharacterized protein LOC130674912 isoform X2 n=1 Tax=Microplitis mediator TaxID=375433 RepID=UPI00255362BE|nr:uncharacterized protein LOC130674912 isoform X2 [Microplitis mediator]